MALPQDPTAVKRNGHDVPAMSDLHGRSVRGSQWAATLFSFASSVVSGKVAIS